MISPVTASLTPAPDVEPDRRRHLPRRQDADRDRQRGALRGADPRRRDPRRGTEARHGARRDTLHRRPPADASDQDPPVLLGRRGVAAALAVAAATAAVAAGCGGDEVEPNPPVTPDPAYGSRSRTSSSSTPTTRTSRRSRSGSCRSPIREIVDGGTQFTNYYDTTPLCCPARAGAPHRPVRPQQRRAREQARLRRSG